MPFFCWGWARARGLFVRDVFVLRFVVWSRQVSGKERERERYFLCWVRWWETRWKGTVGIGAKYLECETCSFLLIKKLLGYGSVTGLYFLFFQTYNFILYKLDFSSNKKKRDSYLKPGVRRLETVRLPHPHLKNLKKAVTKINLNYILKFKKHLSNSRNFLGAFSRSSPILMKICKHVIQYLC